MEQMPSPEKDLEREINDLLAKLETHIDVLLAHTELMNEWYDVDMEGRVGMDRVRAKNNLVAFLEMLERLKKG